MIYIRLMFGYFISRVPHTPQDDTDSQILEVLQQANWGKRKLQVVRNFMLRCPLLSTDINIHFDKRQIDEMSVRCRWLLLTIATIPVIVVINLDAICTARDTGCCLDLLWIRMCSFTLRWHNINGDVLASAVDINIVVACGATSTRTSIGY